MRPTPILTAALLLAACAGNVADYIGPRSGIIAGELVRYGLDLQQSQCVGQHLGANLTPLQLRRLERIASSVEAGFYDPERLTIRDLMHVASTMEDPQIRLELARATDGCGVTAEPPPEPEPAPTPAEAPAAPRPPAWLNLGTAPSGQAIAVDAATLEQEGTFRRAWFRLTNPDVPPSDVAYLLRIDCAGRTIEALAHRRQDVAGTVTEHREYARDEEGPLPIEGGTVMEIAYLALCT